MSEGNMGAREILEHIRELMKRDNSICDEGREFVPGHKPVIEDYEPLHGAAGIPRLAVDTLKSILRLAQAGEILRGRRSSANWAHYEETSSHMQHTALQNLHKTIYRPTDLTDAMHQVTKEDEAQTEMQEASTRSREAATQLAQAEEVVRNVIEQLDSALAELKARCS